MLSRKAVVRDKGVGVVGDVRNGEMNGVYTNHGTHIVVLKRGVDKILTAFVTTRKKKVQQQRGRRIAPV